MDFISKDFPIRVGIGFLRIGADDLADEILKWRAKLGQKCKRSGVQTQESLPTSLLGYTSAPWDRELIVSTQSEWVAYFNNSFQGTDGFGLISYLSEKIGCPGLFINCSSDSPLIAKNQMYIGRAIYEFGDGEDKLNILRSVVVLDDGGRWTYHEEGDVAGFSGIEGLIQEDIRSRVNLGFIQKYCERLGIEIFDEGFYLGEGYLIENMAARNWKRRCVDLSSYA